MFINEIVIFYTEILTGKVWKNPQFNFSSQDLSIERNFFKWDGKITKKKHPLFHRIWKKNITHHENITQFDRISKVENTNFNILHIGMLALVGTLK